MTHLGLFEGIGGFSLAAQWMGWETLAWCEWDEFCQKVLAYHFPKAEGFADITKTNFTKYANRIDVITGGFPCQPYSSAGKQLGKSDPRHLWPEMLRAIREIKAPWVVGENVRGFVTWSGGLVFNEVQSDLEAQGYEVLPFLLPAASVNAPHQRYRVWIIAYNAAYARCQPGNRGKNNEPGKSKHNGKNLIGQKETNFFERFLTPAIATDPGGRRWLQGHQIAKAAITAQNITDWRAFPTQSPFCNRNDGLSRRLDRITFPKIRRESLKAAGNAIVPQVALELYKAIEAYENLKKSTTTKK